MKETVRTRLIEERKHRQWSQQEVADRLGTTRNNVSRWEQGSTTPGPYFRTKLGELFGKSMEELGLFPESGPLPGSLEAEAQAAEKRITTITIEHREQKNPASNISKGAVLASQPDPARTPWRRPQVWLLCGLVVLLLGIIPGGILVVNRWQRKNVQPALTAQQLIDATITAGVRASTNPYGPAQALLVFDDPLQKNISAHYWEVDPLAPVTQNGQHHCLFQDQAYELVADGPNICNEYMSPFTNMVYQVELSQLQGVNAGIDFHATNYNNFYYFHLNTSGEYQLDLVTVEGVKVLVVGSCTCAVQGLHQWNLLAVKVVSATIDLYINMHRVAQVVDATHPSGLVGVGGGAHADTTMNEVLFRNARIWQL